MLSAPDLLKKQAKLLADIRIFFTERGVLEVQTPLLAETTVCDPHIPSLSTQLGDKRLYLQTSPEFAMKRLLASGSPSIYQICKAFREDDVGRHHRPEFTMVEWYRLGFDYHDLMDEVELLVTKLLGTKTFNRLSYVEVFQQSIGLDPMVATEAELKDAACEVSGELDRDGLLDLILGTQVIPTFNDQAIFIYDYPKSQASQAKTNGDFAERFELIINGIELANGYTELTDAAEQRRRFNAENRQRERSQQDLIPVDEEFLTAVDNLPECAGVALGLDRLLMLACGKQSLDEVLFF